MNKILLDTNAYSALLHGNKKIFELISKTKIIYLSVIVVGELFAGINAGTKNKII